MTGTSNMYYLGVIAILFIHGGVAVKVYTLYRHRAFTQHEPRTFYISLLIGLALLEVYSIWLRDPIYIVSNIIGMCNAGAALWIICGNNKTYEQYFIAIPKEPSDKKNAQVVDMLINWNIEEQRKKHYD